ncbi:MAG: signal transduction histidine kinase [Glaciecola sp.]|jgi:signal transduction histidine kinase
MSNTTPRKKQLRTRKLIDKSLQLRMVGAFIAVGCVATLFQVVLLNYSMLDLSEKLAKNGDILLAKTPGILIRSVLITMGLLVPALTLVGILITHRIAGPAYRMRCYFLEIMDTGKVTYKCTIRKHDELQQMCVRVNKAIARVQADYPMQTEDNTQGSTPALDDTPSLSPTLPTKAHQNEDQAL